MSQYPVEEVPPPPLSMMVSAKALPEHRHMKNAKANNRFHLGQRLRSFMR
jgi:hypothetical protein